MSLSLGAEGWPQVIAHHVGGDGYDAMLAFFDFLDRYRGCRLTTSFAQACSPPLLRSNGAGTVERIEVVERSPDGAWFVWLVGTNTSGCEQMGYGRPALLAWLAETFGPAFRPDV